MSNVTTETTTETQETPEHLQMKRNRRTQNVEVEVDEEVDGKFQTVIARNFIMFRMV